MFKTKLLRKKRVCLSVFLFLLVSSWFKGFNHKDFSQKIPNTELTGELEHSYPDLSLSLLKVEGENEKNLKGQNRKQQHNIIDNIDTQTDTTTPTRVGFNKMTFDIDLVTKSFTSCHEKNLDLSAYVIGYSEIYNFFNVLGTVFGFIASDVKDKIEILEKLRNDQTDEHSPNYSEVESMMTFEIERNKKSDKELFGSRTLLRLHRALEFTKVFLEELGKMEDHDKVSTMAKDVYHKTLAKFHPWLIRNAASLALYSLPTRKDLVKKIAPNGIDEDLLREKISECTKKMDLVFADVDELYSKYSLHKLP